MKKNLPIIALCVLLVSLAFGDVATAGTTVDPATPGSGHHRMQAKDAFGPISRYVRMNMAAQTIADITQQPVDTIRQKLQQERLPAVLTEYKIDWQTFATAMQAKVQDLLGKLVDSNYLTADQRDKILARMNQHVQRRALMKTVIEKAVTDGTITPDQAQMLLKRPL